MWRKCLSSSEELFFVLQGSTAEEEREREGGREGGREGEREGG